MKKVNSDILLFKISVGTLSIIPLFANATMTIDDSNIGNYTNTGITANDDNVEIKTTSATAPHIDMNSRGIAISAKNGKVLTIGDTDSTDKFIIRNNAAGNYNSVYGLHIISANVIANSELDVSLKDGSGIYIASKGSGLFQKKVAITGIENGQFIGIRTYNNSAASLSTGTFNKEVKITASGQDSYGIYSQRNNKPNALGSKLTFKDKVTIKMSGSNNAHGIVFDQIPFKNGNPEPDGGSVIYLENGVNLTTDHGTSISMQQVDGKLEINSGLNENRIISEDNQHYNAIEALAGKVDIAGKSNIKGDVYSSSSKLIEDKDVITKGVINFKLANGSTLLTSMENNALSNSKNKGEINLAISGHDSQWKMTDSSSIDSLILGDNAKVSFGYAYAAPSLPASLDGTNAMTLSSGSLAGNGIFEMRTAIGKTFAHDLLKITGSQQAAGNHKIAIVDNKTGAATVTGNEKFTLVETEGGGANFGLSAPSFDIGAYQFSTLTKVSNNRGAGTEDWVLSGSAASNDNNNTNDNGGQNKPVSPKPQLTHTAQNAASILNSNYLMSYVETQTLLQRMGQIRTNNTSHGETWGRIYTGKLSSFNDKRLSDFDMNYYGLQFGIDRKLGHNNEDIYYGIMGGLSKGDVNHNVGDGNTKSYSVALYATLQSQNGFYMDGLVKYMYMSNKFNSLTGGSYSVKGHGNTEGFSIGTEIGKRVQLSSARQTAQGWYLEPQAQVTFSHQNGATINATNGLTTKLGSYNSLIARASIILGYTIQSNENLVDIYFKTGYLKEFGGETSYTFNHAAREKYDFGGNWWDNGIGINIQLNQRHHFYGDVVYSLGNKFDRKQVNVGYRFDF
ncbi:autotransporter outer membrane beta-barrel domain-containing protein [Snodgrassella sp. ESL0253]|uniref:autotransporter outer membrane beta-barrel domain-containing protein n=1 Tax=Snodgrassella sp. ESL0253 TaxID=2705031 RepID=UPI0015825061|nr:autotransporter outer membrane beta-barrel domain-containing protein [Snodgrassella sp. ESL0253]NUE67638.1 autotransporter outer membrane beta-barrel domain-containing protein [Snodgrassella sp. ESL0253]